MDIEFTDKPTQQDIDFLTKKINEETAEYGVSKPFAFFIRNGQMIAGANGVVLYGKIYTDQLWVEPSYRKQGLARQLMNRVHKYGIQQHCKIATVCTMDFQNAIDFYEKLGYVVDFERQHCANNSCCIFMSKQLK